MADPQVAALLAIIIATAAVAICAVVGIVVLALKPAQRWPVWLIVISCVVGIPLVRNALFGMALMPHSVEAIAALLAIIIATAAVAICAVVGIVVLVLKPAQRTFLSYSAVLLALAVCSLIFLRGGLLG